MKYLPDPDYPSARVTNDAQCLRMGYIESGTHEIIRVVDHRLLSEPEKLAALLAAVYVQKQFMLDKGGWFADVIPTVEQFHHETVEALKHGS